MMTSNLCGPDGERRFDYLVMQMIIPRRWLGLCAVATRCNPPAPPEIGRPVEKSASASEP